MTATATAAQRTVCTQQTAIVGASCTLQMPARNGVRERYRPHLVFSAQSRYIGKRLPHRLLQYWQLTCWQQAVTGPQQQDCAVPGVFWAFWPQQHATGTGGC